MKLIVIDKGDPSVGIPATSYEVDCPFEDNTDKQELKEFKELVLHLYAVFCAGKIELLYDFEIEAIENSFKDYGLNNG
jgi:hypothetical protein